MLFVFFFRVSKPFLRKELHLIECPEQTAPNRKQTDQQIKIIHSFDADFSIQFRRAIQNAVASCVHRAMAINDRDNVEM